MDDSKKPCSTGLQVSVSDANLGVTLRKALLGERWAKVWSGRGEADVRLKATKWFGSWDQGEMFVEL